MAYILFLTLYYPPEKGAAASRISQYAEHLVQRGHQVTVLTTVPNYPTGVVPPEYRGRLLQEETRAGVRVVRVWSYTSPNRGFLRRILAHLSFGCLAPILGARAVGHPDLLVVESHPLFNAIAGRLLARWKGSPYVFTVSDLWPESAVQLGVLRNRLLIRLAEWLEWSSYERASLVWVLTEGIRDQLLRRGLAAEKIFFLTNGVDTSKFFPRPQAEARQLLGWEERFTVLYAGTLGISHGLTTVLDAAEQLRSYPAIRIRLVGDGGAKPELLAEARRRGLENVIFMDPFPHEQVPLLLAAADACLIMMRKLPLFEGALPCKMYEALACGRPILLAVDGEARRLAEEAGAAIFVEPENPTALAQAIVKLYEQPALAQALSARGRALAEERFDYDQLSACLDAQIAALLPSSSFTPTLPSLAQEQQHQQEYKADKSISYR
ncbi:MAG: glycosyltransferase family 4 protein [Thermogemmatispora sp.]|jgi:colanic acid biosynthesis glycosyl transferase WcaI|uniref:Glycosyltransferase WbuB n=1 Tax=Thermogemmatispora aurantia TaxID=2045279 RepID=A0A5J4KF94_9CHLR|nr:MULTISPECIES: glycosyltransferase family 4 protein [Thermogemmatispora]MBE3566453.1 glycosyltransferase family 4 protein [Thermogemmatispora sp.]GER85237.1 glycosyltransferase WbuB [Thermogemmatispora aurantia]